MGGRRPTCPTNEIPMSSSRPRPLARRLLPPGLASFAFSSLLPALFALVGCTGAASVPGTEYEGDGPCWFEDVTDAVGLDFVHDPGPTGTYFLPQHLGSGCAFILDGDGTLYIYLLQNAGPNSKSVNRLYKQLPNGKFQDVTAGSGVDVAGYSMGVASAAGKKEGRPHGL